MGTQRSLEARTGQTSSAEEKNKKEFCHFCFEPIQGKIYKSPGKVPYCKESHYELATED